MVEKRRSEATQHHRHGHTEIGPADIELLRKIFRFYPGIEEMLNILRRVAPVGYPIASFADLEDGLGGSDATITLGGKPTPLRAIARRVPMHYFPIANENDLIAKMIELRRHAVSGARRSRMRFAR
jgi:hypothetical protein